MEKDMDSFIEEVVAEVEDAGIDDEFAEEEKTDQSPTSEKGETSGESRTLGQKGGQGSFAATPERSQDSR